MKRQIGICIFMSLLMFVLVFVFAQVNKTNHPKDNVKDTNDTNIESETEDNTQSIISSHEYVTYYFYAKNDNGKISIYDINSQTLYMETGIEISLLSEEIQKELESGIYFKNEVELYDFLECYSS